LQQLAFHGAASSPVLPVQNISALLGRESGKGYLCSRAFESPRRDRSDGKTASAKIGASGGLTIKIDP
jgi:hypothetical protein